MSAYFKTAEERSLSYSPMSADLSCVISILNAGMAGGQTAVHASTKGLRITMFGKTIAKGRTPRELAESFEAARQKARQQAANETAN